MLKYSLIKHIGGKPRSSYACCYVCESQYARLLHVASPVVDRKSSQY